MISSFLERLATHQPPSFFSLFSHTKPADAPIILGIVPTKLAGVHRLALRFNRFHACLMITGCAVLIRASAPRCKSVHCGCAILIVPIGGQNGIDDDAAFK